MQNNYTSIITQFYFLHPELLHLKKIENYIEFTFILTLIR